MQQSGRQSVHRKLLGMTVTSVFARGHVWLSEGHVLLGLAREFFLFVCCSRSAQSKHVFLNILVVQYRRRGVVSHV